VSFPGIAKFANAELHQVSDFSVRRDDFSGKAHFPRSGAIDVNEQGNRIVNVYVKTVRVEEI